MKANQPVAHYSDGRNAWKVSLTGFLIRKRGIWAAVVLTFVTMGVPWWWPDGIPIIIQVPLKPMLAVIVLLGGGVLVWGLVYLRHRTLRSLEMKYRLHKMVHDVRDRMTALHRIAAQAHPIPSGQKFTEVTNLLAEVCENASNYFRVLIGDETIAVAIRLVHADPKTQMVVYRTFARSKGLNSHRSKTSEDIQENNGIPRFLRDEKHSKGVLIYYDLPAAADCGAYQMTENDRRFPNDIITMMVAPLNAWSGKKEGMIGIMYVTSREHGAFHVKHVDSMAFVADHVASAISAAVLIDR